MPFFDKSAQIDAHVVFGTIAAYGDQSDRARHFMSQINSTKVTKLDSEGPADVAKTLFRLCHRPRGDKL
ncbi:MAG: hypothetical protein WBA91_14225, partial [Paracoccaceae bacterium]